MQDQFVNLNNKTYYSIMNSLISPKQLLQKAKDLNQPAIANSDLNSMFANWDLLKYAKEIKDIKPIIGYEVSFCDNLSIEFNKTQRLRHLILLAKNANGYRNLLNLSRISYDNSVLNFKRVVPRIDWEILEKYSKDLICLTSGATGILGQLINTRKEAEAFKCAEKLKDIFGDNLALEIQAHAMIRTANPYVDYVDQSFTNNTIIRFAEKLDIKIVPTCASMYLKPEDAEAHDVQLAIGSGQPVRSNNRMRFTNKDGKPLGEFYPKSREQIVSFFKRLYKDKVESWCDNTLYFAEQCEFPDWVDPAFSNPTKKELPEFPVKEQKDYLNFLTWREQHKEFENLQEDAAYLRFKVLPKLEAYNLTPEDKDKYQKRLDLEFEVFDLKGINSYLEIVQDFLLYCDENNIPRGWGRGSVGGSLVAFFLDIHKADPIKYNLIFERFFNKEKSAMADIDCDFSKDYKKTIEDYIANKYGKEKVAGISNVLTVTPKPYIKAISRVFQYGGDFKTAVRIGIEIADIIPTEIGDIDEAIRKCPLFVEFCKKYPELIKYKDLCGIPIAYGTHAAGKIIGKRNLCDIVPVRKDKEGNLVLEYEKERAEENGLVKMDILGLNTLDIIDSTKKLAKRNNKSIVDVDFHQYDEKTYDLVSNGDTFTVFQLGTSGGTIDLCRKVKPKSIEDISLINALARPSAANIREDFVATKEGKKSYHLLHPKLERAFKSTYGFGLFEEALMYLAQDISGWSLNEADKLRKLTKDKGKYPEKVAKWREEFIEGAVKNNIDRKIAVRIWDEVVDGFQGYGFNVSHSTLYSLISYYTAYLKAHYPLEWLTANLISESSSNTKDAPKNILKIKSELKQLKVKILPPDINKSENTYSIIDENTILTGLDALKFIGKDAIPELILKRPFISFDDLLTRTDGRKVRVPTIQALAAAGALDSFGLTRKQMFLYASDYKKKVKLWQERKPGEEFKYPFEESEDWSVPERFALEVKYLGEGLIGNPHQVYPSFFTPNAINFSKLREDFPESGKEEVKASYGTFQAIVEDYFEFKVKKEGSKIQGQTMARLDLRDPFGNHSGAVIFPRTLEFVKKKLKEKGIKTLEPGIAIHFAGIVNWYEGDCSLNISALKNAHKLPQLPKDLAHKSVKMEIKGNRKKGSKMVELLEDLDQELTEQGLAEPETEEDIFDPEDFIAIEEEESL